MAASREMGIRAGIVRDERYLEHKPGHTHPENPGRLRAVYQMLDRDFVDGLERIEATFANLEDLELIHSPAYINKVLKTAEHDYTSLAPDTPASAKTYLSAWLAVGGCIKGLEAVIEGRCDTCFSLVRPPGHHALPDRAGGFCIFNNLGVAARHAIRRYGMRRILVIDWDVHHGNGLNQVFQEEDRVLYFSSHDPLLYPYSGDWEDTGKGGGEGYTVNLPIPRDLEDGEVLHIYMEVLGPLVRRYEPDLILVDAGFDGHYDDPVGRSRLTEQAYARLALLCLRLRSEIGAPPMFFALEGGYSPRALAGSVREVLKVLVSGDDGREIKFSQTRASGEIVEKARSIHSGYGVWAD